MPLASLSKAAIILPDKLSNPNSNPPPPAKKPTALFIVWLLPKSENKVPLYLIGRFIFNSSLSLVPNPLSLPVLKSVGPL